MIVTGLQPEYPIVLIPTHPGYRLHTLLMISFQKNMIVTSSICHQIGFIDHDPIGKTFGDRVAVIYHLDSEFLIMLICGQMAVCNPNYDSTEKRSLLALSRAGMV